MGIDECRSYEPSHPGECSKFSIPVGKGKEVSFYGYILRVRPCVRFFYLSRQKFVSASNYETGIVLGASHKPDVVSSFTEVSCYFLSSTHSYVRFPADK